MWKEEIKQLQSADHALFSANIRCFRCLLSNQRMRENLEVLQLSLTMLPGNLELSQASDA